MAATEPRAGGRRGPPRGEGSGPPSEELSDAELGLLIAEGPPTERHDLELGVTDGINTHVISGLEGGEQVLIPIPEWRLEFLRQQAGGEDLSDRRQRRRRMF